MSLKKGNDRDSYFAVCGAKRGPAKQTTLAPERFS